MIRVSYVDADGKELGFADNATNLESARAEARIGLRANTYPKAVKVALYQGQSSSAEQLIEEIGRD